VLLLEFVIGGLEAVLEVDLLLNLVLPGAHFSQELGLDHVRGGLDLLNSDRVHALHLQFGSFLIGPLALESAVSGNGTF